MNTLDDIRFFTDKSKEVKEALVLQYSNIEEGNFFLEPTAIQDELHDEEEMQSDDENGVSRLSQFNNLESIFSDKVSCNQFVNLLEDHKYTLKSLDAKGKAALMRRANEEKWFVERFKIQDLKIIVKQIFQRESGKDYLDRKKDLDETYSRENLDFLKRS